MSDQKQLQTREVADCSTSMFRALQSLKVWHFKRRGAIETLGDCKQTQQISTKHAQARMRPSPNTRPISLDFEALQKHVSMQKGIWHSLNSNISIYLHATNVHLCAYACSTYHHILMLPYPVTVTTRGSRKTS